MNDHNSEFERIVYPEFPDNSRPDIIDAHPYGIPSQPAKTGLTPRGKAGIAVVTAVLAGGSLLGWNHYSAQQAAAETKAQELALKQQELRLKELQILGEQASVNAKTQASLDAARQTKIDACVKANKTLVGKQLGATYRSVLEDCQAQYNTTAGVDMQAAASATDTTSTSGGGGGVNPIVLAGGAGFAALAVYGARKARRNPA
jgi:hypothetical protein